MSTSPGASLLLEKIASYFAFVDPLTSNSWIAGFNAFSALAPLALERRTAKQEKKRVHQVGDMPCALAGTRVFHFPWARPSYFSLHSPQSLSRRQLEGRRGGGGSRGRGRGGGGHDMKLEGMHLIVIACILDIPCRCMHLRRDIIQFNQTKNLFEHLHDRPRRGQRIIWPVAYEDLLSRGVLLQWAQLSWGQSPPLRNMVGQFSLML